MALRSRRNRAARSSGLPGRAGAAPLAAAGALALALLAPPGAAHETDQFTVPLGKEFVDVGPYLSDIAAEAVHAAVEQTNERIEINERTGHSPETLKRLRTPDGLADAVWLKFSAAYFFIEELETYVDAKETRERYPGKLVGYEEHFKNIYENVHFALDPRQFFRLFHSSTMKVYGVYLGTDKMGHFSDMGYRYHQSYRWALQEGLTETEAEKKAERMGTRGLLFAEVGMVGYFSAGAYSNADLAANHLGFKFYRNLYAEASLKGERRPPMVTLGDDGFWHVSPHVRIGSDFFSVFMSDHLNEALNPSLFEPGMRSTVRRAISERCDRLLAWYADDNGNPRPRSWFDNRLRDLMTYYGEDYGHQGDYDDLVTIGNTCFDDLDDLETDELTTAGGFDRLHLAARDGDSALARQLLDDGGDVTTTIRSEQRYSIYWGETPLHVAAGAGNVEMVDLLIERGADVGAANQRGATALHRAIGHPAVVQRLLVAGAPVDARDLQGRTALHWSARYPDETVVALLLEHGADPDAADNRGETPLHRAALHGNAAFMQSVIDAGADVNARADLGAAPAHFAVREGGDGSLRVLIAASADLDTRDDFGATPLHDAASEGRAATVGLLLTNDADVGAADVYGSTALHYAARRGHTSTAELLIAWGASINAQNARGSTPLHEAVFAGDDELVERLLELGAAPDLADRAGRSPIDLASARGHKQLAAVMRSHRDARSP